MPVSVEVYTDAVPFVAEVWSPSTGRYDIETKLREYQRRRDVEVWRVHPHERTVTARWLQSDGSYAEAMPTAGVLEPVALPGVRVAVERLWD
jgi:Uma2 family endonuclease